MKKNFLNGHVLVLGGTRSGKSLYAQRLCESFVQNLSTSSQTLSPRLLYIATAQALDDEMKKRIEAHKESRGPLWHTVEEPIHISDILDKEDKKWDVILIDCLTLWLTNLVLLDSKDILTKEKELFFTSITSLKTPCVMVANEVGLGIVPENPLARHFRDEAGSLNQELAKICSHVLFVVAGIAMPIKGKGFDF